MGKVSAYGLVTAKGFRFLITEQRSFKVEKRISEICHNISNIFREFEVVRNLDIDSLSVLLI